MSSYVIEVGVEEYVKVVISGNMVVIYSAYHRREAHDMEDFKWSNRQIINFNKCAEVLNMMLAKKEDFKFSLSHCFIYSKQVFQKRDENLVTYKNGLYFP